MLREVEQLRSTLLDGNPVQARLPERVLPHGGPAFFRTEDPPMEGGKVVGKGMWQHHRDWWGLPNFGKLLVGGYGVGKTISAAKRAIAVAGQCPAWKGCLPDGHRLADLRDGSGDDGSVDSGDPRG